MKLIHVHTIDVASREFKDLAVNLPTATSDRQPLKVHATFSCYALTLLPCKFSSRYTSLNTLRVFPHTRVKVTELDFRACTQCTNLCRHIR